MTEQVEKRDRGGFALLDVSVVDGIGGAPIHDAAIVVHGQRISSITPMSEYRSESGVTEHRLRGHWVVPGLIDAHVHLAGGRADIDDQEHGTMMEPKLLRAMRSVHDAQKLLKRGFTTVRDISWNGFYLKRLFVEHTMPGPKVIAAGPGITRTGGHADMYQYPSDFAADNSPWGMVADGPIEVVEAVRRVLREGGDAVKIFASGGDNWPHDRNSDVHYSFEELRACVDEAHRQAGTIVAAHAESREAIELAVDAGVDTIEHGEDLDVALAQKMAAKGVILVPTLQLIVNWERDFVPAGADNSSKLRPDAFLYRDHYSHDQLGDNGQGARDSFRIALENGVKIALGSDTVFEPLTPYGEYSALELKALVECGMSTMEAITAATKTSSEAVGMSNLVGTIEPGKLADLLVVRKDPTATPEVLYDAANIHLTFCDGLLTVVDGVFVW